MQSETPLEKDDEVFKGSDDDEETGVSLEYRRAKHLSKLRKKNKNRKNGKVVNETYNFAVSTFGRPKYRKISHMDNGNKFSSLSSKEEFENPKAHKKRRDK